MYKNDLYTHFSDYAKSIHPNFSVLHGFSNDKHNGVCEDSYILVDGDTVTKNALVEVERSGGEITYNVVIEGRTLPGFDSLQGATAEFELGIRRYNFNTVLDSHKE